MAKKTGLGKGLDSLIPTSPSAIPENGIEMAAIHKIEPNPKQPRSQINLDDLKELADSIQEHGIIQPLIVTKIESTDSYTLIAGERRLRAAKLADLANVPVVVREASPQDLLELALIENVQRADLNPLEEAEAYRQLGEEFNLTQVEIAKRVGKSRVAVTNTMGLLDLSKVVKQALADGKISEGHARALKGLSKQAQSAAMNTVINKGLNVRQTEELARKLKGKIPTKTAKSNPAQNPEILALQARLRDELGTKVGLNYSPKGGTLVLYYYSDEELNALIERLVGELD